MNRRIKDATIKVYYYDDLASLEAHVLAFVTAYNFAKHLKALRWRTPYQVICEAWTKDPSIFKINPHHLTPGPHTTAIPPIGIRRHAWPRPRSSAPPR